MIIVVDLVSQCGHGYDSPVWLLTDTKKLGEKVIEIMPVLPIFDFEVYDQISYV